MDGDSREEPTEERAARLFGELVEMTAHLRGPDGCPWDRKQTYDTILPHFLEEAHEAAEELAEGDFDGFREELGDTLFLTVFLLRLAEEEGRFTIADSIASILEKMYRRHPHVYGDKTYESDEALHNAWEEAKRREKGKEDRESLLDGIPASLPALLRARRIQQKAASIGFDWQKAPPILGKIEEELGELRVEVERTISHSTDGSQTNRDAIEDEIGDLLFSVVNLARFLDVDPEKALGKTNRKFRRRFVKIEERIDTASPPPLDVLDRYWNEAKEEE